MSFWSRSPLAASTDYPATPEPAERLPGSYLMSVITGLEKVLDGIVSAALTPLANLRTFLSRSENETLVLYATALLLVLSCLMIAFFFNYRASLKSIFHKRFPGFCCREDDLTDEDEYLDDDEDEDEDEDSDDSDHRGRGDRSSKKYYRSRYTAQSTRRRQPRRR